MTEFLVELYISRGEAAAVERAAERTRQAAEQLTREGTPVCYVRSIFVAEDETCFFLCEALSADAVREAVRRAGVRFERVTEAVATTGAEEVETSP